MPTQTIPQHVRDDLQRLHINLTDPTLQALAHYLDLLLDANTRFNLTAIRDRDQAWRKHIIDSLTLLPFLEQTPAHARLIDVGSGGGVPGIPIAIARPDLRVTLAESTGKKAEFLSQTLATLNLTQTTSINARAESLATNPTHRQSYDAAICRAIGPLVNLVEWIMPLLRVGGQLLAM
jgi:16S rRNA (guanine527-N7)-methyltransferase